MDKLNSYKLGPDQNGRFGIFGGRFVAETLMPLILDLEKSYQQAKKDDSFQSELAYLNKYYTCYYYISIILLGLFSYHIQLPL